MAINQIGSGGPRGPSTAALCQAACARGESGHDRGARFMGHARPCTYFVDRPQATNAYARVGVNDAQLDAGRFNFIANPDIVVFHACPATCSANFSAVYPATIAANIILRPVDDAFAAGSALFAAKQFQSPHDNG
jgi:hypothetical protein